MPDKIPEGITREHILEAIAEIDAGVRHGFGESTAYDVLYKGRRYSPKPLVGLAAKRNFGNPLRPDDFKGGRGTKCFSVLKENGFVIVTKGESSLFPNEVRPTDGHVEGAVEQVYVNRYERDAEARAKCISHYGLACLVCHFDFHRAYGTIGEGYIHVHHLIPLSDIREQYVVDPVKDLRPVCPNCHAMLHRRRPPFSPGELRDFPRKTREVEVRRDK